LATARDNIDLAPRPGRHPAGSRGGFTLVELMMVMMVVVMVLAMAAPSMRGFAGGRQTSDAALALLSMTHWCRSDAISQGRRCRLNVDAAGQSCYVTVEQAGDFVPPSGEASQPVQMPEGALAAFRPAQSGQPAPSFVQFYPTGRSDAVTMAVTGKQGETYLLTSAAPTESYRLITPAEGAK
jgi:type IV fimbrial biogenesis protein FimT